MFGAATEKSKSIKPVALYVNKCEGLELATFGAGCFWSIEETFRKIPGVKRTQVGYAGGELSDPSYEQVCTGTTGHTEALQIEFDPQKVTFDSLLDVFWSSHNPTTRNQQGPDIGYQYRSVIFYHSEAQKKAADLSKARLQESGVCGSRSIVTAIEPFTTFFPAEEYHQRYVEKRGRE